MIWHVLTALSIRRIATRSRHLLQIRHVLPISTSKRTQLTSPGNVFERRLIEAYIATNGTDPVTSEALTLDDLIPVRISRIPRPRPPTLTSIPSLLSVFQNEWDAFALDAYTLRQQLSQTRQELATALYQQDAAVRVIARLTRERDEARDALSKVSVGAAPAGDAMQVDTAGLPEDLLEKVDAKHEELSKSRRKRAVPAGWATQDDIQRFGVAQTSETVCPHASFVAVDAAGERALVGGRDGVAGVFDVKENKLVQELAVGGGSVTDGVFFGAQPVVATSSGAVKVFEGAKEVVSFTSHAGSANAVALHPTGDILASVGVDKSFVVYDLVSRKAVAQVYTELGKSLSFPHLSAYIFFVPARTKPAHFVPG
jgi:pre-mRNA-processing factor 19